ncbi:MAG: TonB family protein [Myxococcales bacterium]|nr:TonB family protein [Myxococcales bacterium]
MSARWIGITTLLVGLGSLVPLFATAAVPVGLRSSTVRPIPQYLHNLPTPQKPPPPPPSDAQSDHQLERDIVRRVIYLHVNQIRYCYQQSLSRQPKLAGRLVVRFDITPQGKVQSLLVTESNLSVEMQSCVAETIRTWEFPESDSDENISVNYPFTFRLKTPDAFGGIQVSDAELEALGIFKDPEPPPVEILF